MQTNFNLTNLTEFINVVELLELSFIALPLFFIIVFAYDNYLYTKNLYTKSLKSSSQNLSKGAKNDK